MFEDSVESVQNGDSLAVVFQGTSRVKELERTLVTPK